MGISTGPRTGRRSDNSTHISKLFQTPVSVWASLSRRARLAMYFCATFSIALLFLGSQACLEAYRLKLPCEVRRLEEPGARFLQQICPESHLEVVQLSPLKLVGTVLCPEDTRQDLQVHLQNLYQIRPDQGEDLVLIAGRVPFHWADHPNLAALILSTGLLTLLSVAGIALQHLLYRWRKYRQSRIVLCSLQKQRQRGWLSILLKLSVLATLAAAAIGMASPLVPLAGLGLLTAWGTGKFFCRGLVYLGKPFIHLFVGPGKRLNPGANQSDAGTSRPIQNGLQEAAIILMSLPPEFSAQIFKQLDPDQISRITLEISQLPQISPGMRTETLKTFHAHLDKVCLGQCPGKRGGACDAAAMARTLIDLYLNAPVEQSRPLQLERNRRTRRRIFPCQVCDEVFIDEASLHRHCAKENHGVYPISPPPSPVRPNWRTRLANLLRRGLRWLLVTLMASGLGVGLGLAWAFQTSHPDTSDLLHHQLTRYIANPLFVAIVERQGESSVLVAVVRGSSNSPQLRSLLRDCSLQLGLNPDKVQSMELPFENSDHSPVLGISLLLPSLMVCAGLGYRIKRRGNLPTPPSSTPLPESHPSLAQSSASSQSTSPQSTLTQTMSTQPSGPKTSSTQATPLSSHPTLETLRSQLGVDLISIEVGRALLPLVDANCGAPLIERLQNIRRHVVTEMGLVLPGVRFRDNLRLAANHYRIKIKGRVVARGELQPQYHLAIGPESRLRSLSDKLTQDPTYGMPSAWIKPEQRGDSELLGCAIFTPVAVMAMQITEVVRHHAWEFFSYQEACALLERPFLKPVLEALHAVGVNKPLIWEILRRLLQEQICIADLETILESILLVCSHTLRAEDLCEHVRLALRGSTFQRLCADEHGVPTGKLLAFRITGEMEATLRQPLEPHSASELLLEMQLIVEKLRDTSRRAILVSSPDCRVALRQLLDSSPHTVVLSLAEIPPEANIEWFTDGPQPA